MIDQIKGAAYTAISQYASVIEGFVSFEEAHQIVKRWCEGLDMKRYFDRDISGHGAIMQDTKILKLMQKDAWDALTYFDII